MVIPGSVKPEIGGVLGQRLDLNAAFLVLDAEFAVG
jgi:hypothetical protein